MLGQILLSLSAVTQMFGPLLADFNHTHVLNPRWPPHARFHNGQTMSMGVGLGFATLFYTFGPFFKHVSLSSKSRGAPAAESTTAKQDRFLTAAIFGSLYWIAGISAILYPGSLAVDPEFGEGFPQLPLFSGLAVVSWVGWWLETRKGGKEA